MKGIAVVGLGCWYPGAKNPTELWENVLSKRREFRNFLDQRLPIEDYFDNDAKTPDKVYACLAAYIDSFSFDPVKWRIPKKTFESTDIVQWLALEVAKQCLDDAGYSRETLPRDRMGVVVGNSLTGEQSRASNMRLRWPYVLRCLISVLNDKNIPKQIQEEWSAALEIKYKSTFPEVNEDSLQGGLSNTIAGRVCNYFDLHGGGFVVDGACSSSLISVCTASDYLVSGKWDLALAGGVDVSLDTFELIGFAKTGALTADDMRVYDRQASGFIPGEGCGFVLLKRLEDAIRDRDEVYSVIRGWGISSDGKGGITAPSRDGQATALSRAYQMAGYSPIELDFIEGHGTGTAVGDRVELDGISQAMSRFNKPDDRICGVTSLKSIIGHTKAASGVGALIKAVIAANRRVIPPLAGCKEPNPVFNISARPLYPLINGRIEDHDKKLRIGVSAMGFGGINSHVTLESMSNPSQRLQSSIDERALLSSGQDTELFILGADSIFDLREQIKNLTSQAVNLSMSDLTDLANNLTLIYKRNSIFRAAIIARTTNELLEHLHTIALWLDDDKFEKGTIKSDNQGMIWISFDAMKPRIGFLMPGQGAQQLAMGKMLVDRFTWAQDMLDRVDTLTQEMIGRPISPLIYPDLDRLVYNEEKEPYLRELQKTEIAQPAICFVSCLYAKFLAQLGITPDVVGGHSLGELTAFHIAGAFNEDELLALAALRGYAMANAGENLGGMVSLSCSSNKVESLLQRVKGYAVIANVNSPMQTVVSGELDALEELIIEAGINNISCKQLPVSGAFHSKLVEKAAMKLKSDMNIPLTLGNLKCSLISSTDGSFMGSGLSLRDHFATQIVSQVKFIPLVKQMRNACDLIIEVGPGKILTSLANQILEEDLGICNSVADYPSSTLSLHIALARIFTHGVDINWSVLQSNRLTRPFVPQAQRKFIDNPCERLEFSNKQNHSFDKNLKVLRDSKLNMPVNYKATSDSIIRVQAGQENDVSRNSEPKVDTSRIQAKFIDIISRRTGYPEESITLQSRLLDDLNLDSIKSGEMVAAVAEYAGVAGKIDPTQFANATVGEVISVVYKESNDGVVIDVQGSGTSSGPEPKVDTSRIQAKFIDIISRRTGYPEESITLQSRLLDDLNLDSIKSGEMVAAVAEYAGVAGKIDPTQFANATVSEVISAVYKESNDGVVIDVQGSGTFSGPESYFDTGNNPTVQFLHHKSTVVPTHSIENAKSSNGIGSFEIQMVEQPLITEGNLDTLVWKNITVTILFDHKEMDFANVLSQMFSSAGANVNFRSFDSQIQTEEVICSDNCWVIAVLPGLQEGESDEWMQITQAMGKLHKAVSLITSDTNLAIVHFNKSLISTKNQVVNTIGFASSISLERPQIRIRVLDFESRTKPEITSAILMLELQQPDPFIAATYDENLARKVRQAISYYPGKQNERSEFLTSEDVVLVTGGAKGITAECAIALAKESGAKLALVGFSPKPEKRFEGNEITDTLDRLSEMGIICNYFCCDITDLNAVKKLILQINMEIGQVSAIIHGAGRNQPKRIEQASLLQGIVEVMPKLQGIINILIALENSPLRMLVALSSIIGITGMQGNAWYAFSNEVLDNIVQRFAFEHPKTVALSIAYSVWGETGMGHRLGVVDNLSKHGVGAIPTSEGTKWFIQLLRSHTKPTPVIVAGALEGLATWRILQPSNSTDKLHFRFLEQIMAQELDVSLRAGCKLSLDVDGYLKDHNFNGSYLFPTVFGLEAMAQAATTMVGANAKTIKAIENIDLNRPIVVNNEEGTNIEFWAEAGRADFSNEKSVRVGIRCAQTGFMSDHFSSSIIFGDYDSSPDYSIYLPEYPLPIDPKLDLYGPILFQGPLFHRIKEIYALTDDCVLFTARAESFKNASEKYLTYDPFFHDALLQVVQLPLAPSIVLPIYIGRIDFFKGVEIPGSRTILANLKHKSERESSWDIFVCDSNGMLIERLTDYKVRVVRNPSKKEEFSLMSTITHTVEKQLSDLVEQTTYTNKFRKPTVCVDIWPSILKPSKEKRHEMEMPLIERTVRLELASTTVDVQKIHVDWDSYGKPYLLGSLGEQLDFSISHVGPYCLCVASHDKQGCDIELVSERTESEWFTLLVGINGELLRELIAKKQSINISGTRIWGALEAIKKASRDQIVRMTLISINEDVVLFEAVMKNTEKLSVITLPIRFCEVSYLLAFVAYKDTVNNLRIDDESHTAYLTSDNFYSCAHGARFIFDEKLKHPIYEYKFQTTFRDASSKSGYIAPSRYTEWAGKVRELVLSEIGSELVLQISTGEWGLVTNWTDLRLVDEAQAYDHILARFQLNHNVGSVIPFWCEFYKIMPDGVLQGLATVEQETTWVRVLGHGKVAPAEMPDYLDKFLSHMTQTDSITSPSSLVGQYTNMDIGEILNVVKKGPGHNKNILHTKIFATTLEESNLVGNIYYANYISWQGNLRDSYLYSIMPQLFKNTENKQEFVCLHSRINFLRDAMPFDQIRVTLRMWAVGKNGVELEFEYWRILPGNALEKLAIGYQTFVWVNRDENGKSIVIELPEVLKNSLMRESKTANSTPVFALTID
ncbi:MAG: SDR family NAD(P)-dependent oxidoreductase [Methylobacter sp.]|nr:SDR family NAD(P)-dependent oxidoreductase [Methylobacter sp.]